MRARRIGVGRTTWEGRMAKASRQRHRAKDQNRAKERSRRQHDASQAAGAGHRPSPADRLSAADRLTALAEQLMADAVTARFRKDPDMFERCAAQLAERPGTPGWQRIADQVLFASLLPGVTAAWRQGWQPAELVRQASRMAGDWHAVMATDLIGAELDRYAAATIAERWNVQLTELGVKLRPLNADYLEHWAARAGTA